VPGLTVTVLFQDITRLEAEAVIVGFHENARPLKQLAGRLDWLLCGSLSNLIITNKIQGALGDIALLTSQKKIPAPKILMIGLGPESAASPASLTFAVRNAVASAVKAGVKSAALDCFVSPRGYESDLPAILAGLSQGAGAADIQIALLAPDATAYEMIAKLMNRES
jgi:hypothetical protein